MKPLQQSHVGLPAGRTYRSFGHELPHGRKLSAMMWTMMIKVPGAEMMDRSRRSSVGLYEAAVRPPAPRPLAIMGEFTPRRCPGPSSADSELPARRP